MSSSLLDLNSAVRMRCLPGDKSLLCNHVGHRLKCLDIASARWSASPLATFDELSNRVHINYDPRLPDGSSGDWIKVDGEDVLGLPANIRTRRSATACRGLVVVIGHDDGDFTNYRVR